MDDDTKMTKVELLYWLKSEILRQKCSCLENIIETTKTEVEIGKDKTFRGAFLRGKSAAYDDMNTIIDSCITKELYASIGGEENGS